MAAAATPSAPARSAIQRARDEAVPPVPRVPPGESGVERRAIRPVKCTLASGRTSNYFAMTRELRPAMTISRLVFSSDRVTSGEMALGVIAALGFNQLSVLP
jgi:hypothetical protein